MTSFTTLDQIAQVSLGYKSLQNDFYYLNKETVESYGVESRFLQPIILLNQLDAKTYRQTPTVSTWLFVCREKEADLRGTGALRYLQARSEAPAAERKQSGAPKTVRQVLEAQGGGLWYAPKALPCPAHIWLRKAFDTVFAPYVFSEERVVDQRCNYLKPLHNLSPELIGAVLTSTLFSYALEINGSASMGAGALEAPTTKLRRYPVFDPRTLTAVQQAQLIKLAQAVWDGEVPVNWASDKGGPGVRMRALDAWLLLRAKSELKLDQLYTDLRGSCQARINVAKDKTKTKKKQKTESISSVAQGITNSLAPALNVRQFPEGFFDGEKSLAVHVERSLLRRIRLSPLMDMAEVILSGENGRELFKGTYPLPVAEAVVRSVLMGRESFLLPTDRRDAENAVAEFLTWFDDIRMRLDEAINESALGTGYEDVLRNQVYQRLGVQLAAGERQLPTLINLAAQ